MPVTPVHDHICTYETPTCNSHFKGRITLKEGTQMVMPGDNFNATVELQLPVAMEAGLRFAIRDSGRTVGAGVVTKALK